MAKIVTVVGSDNKIYDATVHSPFSGFVEVIVYEVKNPDRKFFGRQKFYPYSRTLIIDEFDSIHEAINYTIEKWIDEKRIETERKEKWNNFYKMG